MCISSGYYLQKKRNEMKTKKSKDTTPESMFVSPTVFILCVKLACFIIFNLLYNIYIRYFLKHRPHAHIWHSSLFSVSSILTWYYAPWLARVSTVHTLQCDCPRKHAHWIELYSVFQMLTRFCTEELHEHLISLFSCDHCASVQLWFQHFWSAPLRRAYYIQV